jgi:hypothetical protein
MGQQPVWIMIALVLDAVIAVTGILIGPSLNLTGLLAAGPLLACARCNRRRPARPRRAPRPGVSYQTLPGGHFRNANGVASTGGQESRNGRPTSR